MTRPDPSTALQRFCALTLEIEQAWTAGDDSLAAQLAQERAKVLSELEQYPPSPEHLQALRSAGALDTRLIEVLEAEIHSVKGRLTAVHRSKQAHAAYCGGKQSPPRLIEREG